MYTIINNQKYHINSTALLNTLADFNTIESRADLNQRKFTLYDYNNLYTILRDLVLFNTIDNCFISKSLKAYLSGFGIKCIEKVKNVNYTLTA